MLSRLGGRGQCVEEDATPYALAEFDFDPDPDPDFDPDPDPDFDPDSVKT